MASRSPDAGATATAAPDSPPVLGRPSISGPMPWRLPPEPVQSAVAADEALLGDLTVRAASVVGAAHRCDEPALPRQDAYGLARTARGDHLIVAVADGVSSSRHAEIGARVAVSTALRTTRAALEHASAKASLDAVDIFQRTAGEMAGTARNRGWSADQVCAALLIAVLPAEGRGRSRNIWTAQVGDVSTWTHEAAGWVQRTGVVKEGLDRNQLDAVLPFRPQHVSVSSLELLSGQPIAFMTDGLGDSLVQVPAARDYFARRWSGPSTVVDFLRDLSFDAAGQDDDRTAVVVWPERASRPWRSRRQAR